jgi:hypothetical protein
LKELELKKAKLNELRRESRKAEAEIARCRDDDTDAQRLTPDGCVVENNYIQVSACRQGGTSQQYGQRDTGSARGCSSSLQALA